MSRVREGLRWAIVLMLSAGSLQSGTSAVRGQSSSAPSGLLARTLVASFVTDGAGCSSLLVSGQVLAPSPGYTFALQPSVIQPDPSVIRLTLTAIEPTSLTIQVLTPTPVTYYDPERRECPREVVIEVGQQQTFSAQLLAARLGG